MADGDTTDIFNWRRRTAEGAQPAALTVTELTSRIKRDLENNFQGVWVEGEISNLSRPNSGHIYLTLKDDRAQISAVLWRSDARRLRFDLKDGLSVLVQGDITVYPPRGAYQITVRRIMPKGMGALQLAFMQLREKLEKEGLFAPEHKKPLPPVPRRIGIVTSPSGAAIRDILKQIHRRFPQVEILLYPAAVQGDRAAQEIAWGIDALNEYGGVDVMIVGRGGGSLEDLWAFNEEIVARAIFASRVPVISAVGHEVDVTISDLVADARALTPTAAGEMVVPDCAELCRRLAHHQDRLRHSLARKVELMRERLRVVEQAAVLRRPTLQIEMLRQRLDEYQQNLQRTSARWLARLRERAAALVGRLESLSPLKVLARGYSITLKPDGTVVRRAQDVSPGDSIRSIVAEGRITSEVKIVETGEWRRNDGRQEADI